SPFFYRAVVGIFLISIVSAIAGSLAVLKRSTYAVTGMAHSALGGAAFGILMRSIGLAFFTPLLGELIFGIALAMFIGSIVSEIRDEKTDLIIGVSFALVMSLSVMLITSIREYASVVWGYIVGDVLLLTENDILDLFVVTCIILFIVAILFRHFVYVSFDADSARALGIPVTFVINMLYIVIALSVVVSLKAIGSILVYVYMTLPPSIANKMSKDAYNMVTYTFIIALVSGIIGLLVSMVLGISPSAITGMIIALLYTIALIFKR
ncbi:MAG: metal ABC transporter permease, partial [Candidatus Korarchaeota archaeon]